MHHHLLHHCTQIRFLPHGMSHIVFLITKRVQLISVSSSNCQLFSPPMKILCCVPMDESFCSQRKHARVSSHVWALQRSSMRTMELAVVSPWNVAPLCGTNKAHVKCGGSVAEVSRPRVLAGSNSNNSRPRDAR